MKVESKQDKNGTTYWLASARRLNGRAVLVEGHTIGEAMKGCAAIMYATRPQPHLNDTVKK